MTKSATPRTALVTGAAGVIGSALVAKLASDRLRVVAVDVSAQRLALLASDVPGIVTVVADVSEPDGVERAIASAGPVIDVVCNSAGVADGGNSIEELDDAIWERVLRINLTSIYLICNRVTPGMIERHHGVIINISSVAGLRGGRAGAGYTATKWAVVGLTQNIAASLGPEGIRAHALCPSRIEGAIELNQGVRRTERGKLRSERDRGRPEAGRAVDVAETASFLISNAASHLNGLALPVDAGWLAF